MSQGNSATYLQQLFGLDGLTAVVIGGTGVLGGSFCDALAAAGAHVVVVGNNPEKGAARVGRIADAGGSAEFFQASCTERADLEALVDHLRQADRHCHILINGAGVNSATPFLEISDEEWERIVNVNLRGVHLACQVFGRFMLDTKTAGSIINIASLSGITPLSRVFTYSATKAAVINLTKNLAREWAPHGIRVNALSPGFFPAEQNRKVLTPDRVDCIRAHTPMKRPDNSIDPPDSQSPFGSPEELAGAILLLASPRAGSFLTGENLVVDGGFMAMTI